MPAMRVIVGESGTGGGFQKFCRGETVISDASRPIKTSEMDACAAAGIAFVELPVAYDGLAVVVHPENTWVDTMTAAELKRLWEPAAQGQIQRWSQIRPEWPDEEINLYGPGTASGTFDYFTEAIVGETQASRGDYTPSEDDNVLVQGIAGDRYALGYFGLAYFEQNQDKLKLVAIDDEDASNGEGGIRPSFETVRGGTYRPLSRPLFVYVNAAALDTRPEVQSFVEYYLQLDDALIRDVGYVPLAAVEQELVRARLAARTPGTMFATASQTDSLEALLRGHQ
jgi:phosphate transport system substrate-binding protein